MTQLEPEQRADGRRSQVYLLRLWCEEAGALWRLSLRTHQPRRPARVNVFWYCIL
jgi:hypothetical protein